MYDSHYFNDFLESQLKIKIQEKAQYGEVFTPLAIIDEKLASLPPSCGFQKLLVLFCFIKFEIK